jgi:hypothetical protein
MHTNGSRCRSAVSTAGGPAKVLLTISHFAWTRSNFFPLLQNGIIFICGSSILSISFPCPILSYVVTCFSAVPAVERPYAGILTRSHSLPLHVLSKAHTHSINPNPKALIQLYLALHYRHVGDVVQLIRAKEQTLRALEKKVVLFKLPSDATCPFLLIAKFSNIFRYVLIIATDGEASDGSLVVAMKPLEQLPVIVVVRLCTSDDNVLITANRTVLHH